MVRDTAESALPQFFFHAFWCLYATTVPTHFYRVGVLVARRARYIPVDRLQVVARSTSSRALRTEHPRRRHARQAADYYSAVAVVVQLCRAR